MKLLLAGITGQLGRGLVEASAGQDIELVPLMRAAGTRTPEERLTNLYRGSPFVADAIAGDVCAETWGVKDSDLRRLAPRVNTVLNLAAETNWAGASRRLHAVNVLGALQGFELARALQRLSGSRTTYLHASTIHAGGDVTGWIAEQPFDAGADRTAYEHSKWLAEQLLLQRAEEPDAPAVMIARVGGLVGSTATRSTSKRNSLYVLADRWNELPSRLLPVCPNGRVDMLPRDIAGRLMLSLAEAVEREQPAEAEIVHLCAGESAPTAQAVIEMLRSLDVFGQHANVTTIPLPARLLLPLSRQLERAHRVSPNARNALIALRYMTFNRLFERDHLAARLDATPPTVSTEEIVRLAFDLAAPVRSTRGHEHATLASFHG
jgi:thioester reductase-like protein